MADRKEFTRVTTETGKVFYTREKERVRFMTLPGFKRAEDIWLTEEEYLQIPTSQAAYDFFHSALSFATAPDVSRQEDPPETTSAR